MIDCCISLHISKTDFELVKKTLRTSNYTQDPNAHGLTCCCMYADGLMGNNGKVLRLYVYELLGKT